MMQFDQDAKGKSSTSALHALWFQLFHCNKFHLPQCHKFIKAMSTLHRIAFSHLQYQSQYRPRLTQIFPDACIRLVHLCALDLSVEGVSRVAHAQLELDCLVRHPLVDHRRVHHAGEQEELLTTTVGSLKRGTRSVSHFAEE